MSSGVTRNSEATANNLFEQSPSTGKRLEGTRLRTITMLWICIYLLSLDPDSGKGQRKGPRKTVASVIAYRPFI